MEVRSSVLYADGSTPSCVRLKKQAMHGRRHRSGWSGFNLATFFQERTMNNSIIINDNSATIVKGRSTIIVLLRDPVQLQGQRNQLGRSGPGPAMG